MKLKEQIYRSIEELDNSDLAHLYDHIQSILNAKQRNEVRKPVLSIDEILALTASDSGNWADDVSVDREDRQ